MINRHILADFRRLADHHPHAMINKQAGADFAPRRMNLNPGEKTRQSRNGMSREPPIFSARTSVPMM